MGELATLAKARQELEDLYLGVPDDSVNLTFEDLAKIKEQHGIGEKKKPNMDTIQEKGSNMGKSPSLDFTRGLHATHHQHHGQQHHHHIEDVSRGHHHHVDASRGRQHHVVEEETHHHHHHPHHNHHNNPKRDMGFRHEFEDSVAYDDMSGITTRSGYVERGGRRRPGIPHSNICTICSTYIYIFRHRCLVCGRVFCRHCVTVGMGEMPEGRKCVECLGSRFSQRYIHRAGRVGCCSGYPSIVKQQELKWAEKGPRGSGRRAYGQSEMMSRSRSPLGPNHMSTPRGVLPPRTPREAHDNPSFVVSSQFSPFSSGHPPVPF